MALSEKNLEKIDCANIEDIINEYDKNIDTIVDPLSAESDLDENISEGDSFLFFKILRSKIYNEDELLKKSGIEDKYDLENDRWLIAEVLTKTHDDNINKAAADFDINVKEKWDREKTLKKLLRKIINTSDIEKIKMFKLTICFSYLYFLVFLPEEDIEKDLNLQDIIHSYTDELGIGFTFLLLRYLGDIDNYKEFFELNKEKIEGDIERAKRKISPYLEDNIYTEEIFALRKEIEDLKRQIDNYEKKLENEKKAHLNTQNSIERYKTINNELQEKIDSLREERQNTSIKCQEYKKQMENLEATVKKLKEKNPSPPSFFGPNKLGDDVGIFVRYPDGDGCIATSNAVIQIDFNRIQQLRLLTGDTVRIEREFPEVQASVINPTKEKEYGEGEIILIENSYYVDIGDNNVFCVGKSSQFLPENCEVKISYVPGSQYGLIEMIYTEDNCEETGFNCSEIELPKNFTAYVSGGVKNTAYKQVVEKKYKGSLLWTPFGEARLNIIEANVRKSDIVFVIATYVSHMAYYHIRDACKKHNIPMVMVNTNGLSGFQYFFKKGLKSIA